MLILTVEKTEGVENVIVIKQFTWAMKNPVANKKNYLNEEKFHVQDKLEAQTISWFCLFLSLSVQMSNNFIILNHPRHCYYL